MITRRLFGARRARTVHAAAQFIAGVALATLIAVYMGYAWATWAECWGAC